MKHTLPSTIFCLFKLSAQVESGLGIEGGIEPSGEDEEAL